jgi:hypothetical protein
LEPGDVDEIVATKSSDGAIELAIPGGTMGTAGTIGAEGIKGLEGIGAGTPGITGEAAGRDLS